MAYIKIKLTEIGEGYVQYQSVAAFITIDKEDYLLDSRLLDSEDYQSDLDILYGFHGMWEIRAEADGLKCELDEEVEQLMIELNCMIDSEEEIGLDKFVEKTKNWSPEQWEEYEKETKREQDEADMPGGFN